MEVDKSTSHTRLDCRVDNEKLKASVENNPTQSVKELSEIFSVSKQTILTHLAQIGKVKKQGKWIPKDQGQDLDATAVEGDGSNLYDATTIKVEPELVLLNALEDTTTNTLEQIEHLNNDEFLNLIHEAQFDRNNPLNAENVNKSKEKHLTCGRIDLQLESEKFLVNCNYCNWEFDISKWQDFVKHVKEEHANILATKKQDEIKTEEALKATEATHNDNKSSGAGSIDLETANVDVDIKSDQESNECSDEEYEEPQTKKPKQSEEVPIKPTAKSKKQTKPKSETASSNDHLLTFNTTPRKHLITFLELIESNAILWHRRQSVLKRFNDALTDVVASYNKKCPKYKLTEEQARNSINRIKDLFYRVTDPKHKRHLKNSTHEAKFPEFFSRCHKIEENSKKLIFPCTNCLQYFFTELDLQIHKVRRHRIGELPFKCSRCNYGFSQAEKRDAHEAKHDRLKNNVCQVCNRCFWNEEKLQAHMMTHSDDAKPVCEICGQMFETTNRYRRHKLHHEPPKEKCEICGKLFFEKWNLSEHIKSHKNERQYQCDICNKSFNHQNDVKIHKRGVHNIKTQRKRYVWVNKDEIAGNDNADGDNNGQQQSNSDVDDEEDDETNPYSDNYHYFRPMFMN